LYEHGLLERTPIPLQSRLPVKFAHHTGFKLHQHTGDSFGDQQLLDGRFLSELFPRIFPLDFSNSNLKLGNSFPESKGSGTLF
jgi:hypothetical protein